MPSATSLSALPRPATFVKMEDRKRPAAGAVDDLAPPTKRQAVNGASKSKDDSADKQEEAWIEVSVTRQPCVIQPIKAPLPSCIPTIKSKPCLRRGRATVEGLLQDSQHPVDVFAGGVSPRPMLMRGLLETACPAPRILSLSISSCTHITHRLPSS